MLRTPFYFSTVSLRLSYPTALSWTRITKVLKTSVNPERFAAFSGARSLAFPVGKNGRVAVKVIAPRGNEAISVIKINL
jgi:hypothetical protein